MQSLAGIMFTDWISAFWKAKEMLGSLWEPSFHNSFRISSHIAQVALWSCFAVRPPPKRVQRHKSMGSSCALIPPHTPRASMLSKTQPSSLKNNKQSALFIISHARRDCSREPGSWEVSWKPWGQEFFSVQTRTQEPAERSPRFYTDSSTPLFRGLHSYWLLQKSPEF